MYVSLAVEDCELGLKRELMIWFSALIEDHSPTPRTRPKCTSPLFRSSRVPFGMSTRSFTPYYSPAELVHSSQLTPGLIEKISLNLGLYPHFSRNSSLRC